MALCLPNNRLRPIVEHSIVSLGNCLTDWNMTLVTIIHPGTYPFTGGEANCVSVTRRSGLDQGTLLNQTCRI
jgi:hypothetical protein